MRKFTVIAAALLTPAAAVAHPGHVAAPGTVHHITQHAGEPAYLLGMGLLGLVTLGLAWRLVWRRFR